MFTIPWVGVLTALKASGKAGEKTCMATFVAGAEDGLFLQDSIGAAGRRAYRDVKAGKLGTVAIKMPHRWVCECVISYMDTSGADERLVSKRAIPESLVIVASKKADDPPKVRMKITFEWSERDGEFLFLAKALKREVTVEIGGVQGGLPFEKESNGEPVKKRKGNGQTEASV